MHVVVRREAWVLQRGQRFADLGRFIHGTQATRADFHFDVLAILENGLLVDVGEEAGLGVPVGMAYIVAAHPRL